MIKPAKELKHVTNLDIIGEAIEEANKNGKKYLDLYGCRYFEDGTVYDRSFKYNDDDIEALEKLGYMISIAHERKYYTGMWWWKKNNFIFRYHTIRWD